MPPQNPFRNRKAVVSGLSCTQAEIATPFKCRSLDWIQCFDCHSQDFNSFPLNASQWETGRSDVSKKQHQGNTQTGWKCFPCEISGCRIYLRPINVWFEQVQCSNGGPFAKLKGLKKCEHGGWNYVTWFLCAAKHWHPQHSPAHDVTDSWSSRCWSWCLSAQGILGLLTVSMKCSQPFLSK